MILTLTRNDLLRLEGARGLTIEVLRGRAWLTEAGRPRDAFLVEGTRCRVGGDGLVLLEAQGPASAELALSAGSRESGLLARLREAWRRRRTIDALQGLDDRTLRDIGIARHRLRDGELDRFGPA